MNYENWLVELYSEALKMGVNLGEIDHAAWRESYDEGMTPKQAFLEDLSYATSDIA